MTKDEKEAFLNYLEFALTSMVDELEREGIVHGQPQIAAVYDAAYEVLNEMERTVTSIYEIKIEEQVKVKK